jgi:hypothetical protein
LLIGSKVVAKFNGHGQEAIAAAPNTDLADWLVDNALGPAR